MSSYEFSLPKDKKEWLFWKKLKEYSTVEDTEGKYVIYQADYQVLQLISPEELVYQAEILTEFLTIVYKEYVEKADENDMIYISFDHSNLSEDDHGEDLYLFKDMRKCFDYKELFEEIEYTFKSNKQFVLTGTMEIGVTIFKPSYYRGRVDDEQEKKYSGSCV